MKIIDFVILIYLGFGILLGAKRGFTKQLVIFASVFVSIVVSFIFKNSLSIIFYENLPFFKFGGAIKGVTALNILLYEVLAFLLVFSICMLAFKLLIAFTNLFEKILNATIILGIPSKILGAVVGLIEYYLIVYVVLFVLMLPVFNISNHITDNSTYAESIVTDTPVLSSFTKDVINVADEFIALKDKYQNTDSSMEFNRETLDLFLKYKVITVESVDKLIEKNKLEIDNINELLEPYRKVENA